LVSLKQISHQLLGGTQVCQEGHSFVPVSKIAKALPWYFSFVFCQQRYIMYQPLQIQYSQIAKAALIFIIP